MTNLPVTFEDIELAAARIGDAVVHTPCLRSETLSRIAKADVWVKFENQQFTASFKERGALNTLLQLAPEEKKRGVIAMSAGNHAQGVAYHAGRLGIPATIVMPSFTPNVKAEHTRGHGATVILHGDTLAEAGAEAHRLAETGKLYVYTVVRRSFPGVAVPFVDAIVDLDDGSHLKGTLEGVDPDPDRIPFNMRIKVAYRDAQPVNANGKAYLTYYFLPA